MYPENPEGTQVIVGLMNMGYISDTARNRTHNHLNHSISLCRSYTLIYVGATTSLSICYAPQNTLIATSKLFPSRASNIWNEVPGCSCTAVGAKFCWYLIRSTKRFDHITPALIWSNYITLHYKFNGLPAYITYHSFQLYLLSDIASSIVLSWMLEIPFLVI